MHCATTGLIAYACLGLKGWLPKDTCSCFYIGTYKKITYDGTSVQNVLSCTLNQYKYTDLRLEFHNLWPTMVHGLREHKSTRANFHYYAVVSSLKSAECRIQQSPQRVRASHHNKWQRQGMVAVKINYLSHFFSWGDLYPSYKQTCLQPSSFQFHQRCFCWVHRFPV